MKRVLLFISFCIILSQAFCQTKRQFKTASWGNQKWGFVYHPTTPGKYPAIVFFHGSGEIGQDSNSVNTLLIWGPLQFIKNGWRPNFVIFAVQSSFWTPAPELEKYILDNDAEIKQYWDGVNVMWTGLSAGGQSVLDCIANNYPGSFVPMSAAATNKQIDFTKQYKIWAFHDPNDGVCPLKDVKPIYDKTGAKLTITSDGHNNWNKNYDPASVPSIYDWAFGALPIPQPPAPIKIIFATIQLPDGKTFIVYTDGSYELK